MDGGTGVGNDEGVRVGSRVGCRLIAGGVTYTSSPGIRLESSHGGDPCPKLNESGVNERVSKRK